MNKSIKIFLFPVPILLMIIFLFQLKCVLDNKKKQVTVVMCDITRSLDTNSIKKVTDIALNILTKSLDAEVYFYPIDSNLYVDFILHKESYSGLRYTELLDTVEKDKKKLSESIFRIYQIRNTRVSCILKGFNIAYKKFMEYSLSEQYDFQLVFLSDMLEYCSYNFGFLDLERITNYKSTMGSIQKYKPDFDLKKLNVKITIVMTASRQLPIDESLHREFWREAFKNFGYDEKDFEHIYFTSNLPKNFGL